MAKDGLEEVVLGQEWCGNPAHATVRVDPRRAEWLRDNGYEDAPMLDIPETAPRGRKRARRLDEPAEGDS